MYRVIISSVSDRGVLPLVFEDFSHKILADEYVAGWRETAKRAGELIKVERKTV